MMELYFGTVEDRSGDTLKATRYKVRVIGVHNPLRDALPTADLPWAVPLQNNSAAMSGVGTSATGYLQGSLVAVVFLDEDRQVPLIMGSVAGVPGTNDYTGSELFASVTNDVRLVPPNAPLDNTTVDGVETEPGYIGTLTASDVRKMIPYIGQIRGGTASRVTAVGLGKYQTSIDDLVDLGYLAEDKTTWTGLNDMKSQDQFLASEGTQYDAEEVLLKQQYMKLVKMGAVSTSTPKEKLSGVLFASHVGGVYVAYTYLSEGVDETNSNGETCSGMYVHGYKTIAGKSTEEQPTLTNINEEASDKHESRSIQQSKYDVKPVNKGVSNQGFTDPDSVYPLIGHENEPDTPRLASGLKVDETIVGFKETVMVKSVPVALSSVTWKQSPVPYNAVYPNNNVYQSPSGHVMEFDDTKGSERVHVAHRTGTFWEVDNAGNEVNRTMGIRTVIVDKDELVYIKGSGYVTVDGDLALRVAKALNVEILGDANLKVSGNMTQEIGGDYSLKVGGKLAIKSMSMDVEGTSGLNLNSTSLLFKSPTIVVNPVTGDIMFGAHSSAPGSVSADSVPSFSPTITLPSPITRKELQALELEDTTASTILANSKVYPAPTATREDVAQPVNAITAVTSVNELPENITYQTRLSTNYTVRDVCVGNLGSTFPFDGQHGKTAKELAENLKALCLNCLEPIRAQYLSKGFMLNSCMRPAGNPLSMVGKTSQHEFGQAADLSFSMVRGQPTDREQFYEIASWIRDNILFDQLLLEYRDEGRQVWIHISHNKNGNRRQVLTLNNDSVLKSGLVQLA